VVVLFCRMDTSSYKVEQEVKLVTKYGIYPAGTVGKITAIENGMITVGLTQFGGHQKIRIEHGGIIEAAQLASRRPASPPPTV
jgi:hypothetical protein